MTNLNEQEQQLAFVKEAIDYFNSHEKIYTYGSLEKGSLFAMRWGMMDDCVLLLKLDEEFTRINYQNCLERSKA